jgi:pimeloyl-ACP methyl ester carboxylesterase
MMFDEKFVHYNVLRRGRPIIFVYGWFGSWRYWVSAMLSAVQKKWNDRVHWSPGGSGGGFIFRFGCFLDIPTPLR